MNNTLQLDRKVGVDGREFFDFVVSGESLYVAARKTHEGRLWTDNANLRKDTINKLIMKVSPDFSNNRVAIYGCGECGDIRCGGLSVRIEIRDGVVIWSNFERFYHDDSYGGLACEPIPYLSEMRFEQQQYEAALKAIL